MIFVLSFFDCLFYIEVLLYSLNLCSPNVMCMQIVAINIATVTILKHLIELAVFVVYFIIIFSLILFGYKHMLVKEVYLKLNGR